ncbi:MAG: glycosyltransferase family 2 protein [Verrucomicrobia bacterium]|jgi:dolichol-phosphate mannosyltransferase|nr:glycosyltransferase family 2 protein [Verrucomicrobiota bacterium]
MIPVTEPAGVSVIIPVYNESGNLEILCHRTLDILRAMDRPHEILFVNDGSLDGSSEELDRLASAHPGVRVLHLRRNFGQTAAMMAGIDHALHEILVPMDGDLQNDPADIPRLLAKLDEGYDVVSGWRRSRQDGFLRVLLSRVANRLISMISGVRLQDYGCSMKAYRREALDTVRLYGEMHRLIPIYADWNGARVTEMEVNHHPRVNGRSKYGMGRIPKVMLDLLVVTFLRRYAEKPIYIFGGIGLLAFLSSFAILALAFGYKLFAGVSLIQTPLPLLAGLAFVTGIICFLMGLQTELIARTYHESQDKRTYVVRGTPGLKSCAASREFGDKAA